MDMNIPENIMSPRHPLWDEFANRLESNVGSCNQSSKKPQSRNILHALNQQIQAGKAAGPHIDVEASLRWFEGQGGNCDCDVLLFVVGT